MANSNAALVRARRIQGLLGVAIIAQFFWWDQKCPQVMRDGGYGGGNGDGDGDGDASGNANGNTNGNAYG